MESESFVFLSEVRGPEIRVVIRFHPIEVLVNILF